MNKKYLMLGIPLLAIVLVAAAVLSYYAIFTFNVNGIQPITINGNPISEESIILSDFDCIAEGTSIGPDAIL